MKTAGTSMEIALSQFCDENDIITPITPEDELLREEFGGQGPVNYLLPPPGLKLLNRLNFRRPRKPLQYYNHIPAGKIRELVGKKIWKTYFKFCFERNPWDKAISLYYWVNRNNPQAPSFDEFLADGRNRRDLSNYYLYTINNKIAVDLIGRYENLDREFERIAAYLKLPRKIALPHAKSEFRTDRRHYREFLDETQKNLIATICAKEIEYLGYSFAD